MEEDRLYEKAKQRAFRLLAMRARSEKEIRVKLKERGFDESAVRSAVARLRELKYLDDKSFARQWARNLALNKLQGDRRIEESLREKGIHRDVIKQVISELRKEFSEEQAIRQFIRKKDLSNAGHSDGKEKRRLARNLMSRGFPPELIFDMLSSPREEFIDEGE